MEKHAHGCGLTRAIICIFHGNIVESLKYNILAIPLIIVYILYSIYYIRDSIKKSNDLKVFIEKNKKIIIVISMILFTISLIRNLNNPLLY